MPRQEKLRERVYCGDCKKASLFIGNGNFCAAKKRRVCSCNRYGKFCDEYERKI